MDIDVGMDSFSPPPDFDNLLSGVAGYRVLSSDLRHVADQLAALDTAMLSAPNWAPPDPDLAHYNPSDLASWVDSMLDPNPNPNPITPPPTITSTCTAETAPPQIFPLPADEDAAIHLVRLLITCADSIQRGDTGLAGNLLTEMTSLLARVGTGFGIGKVGGYFADALYRRLYSLPPPKATSADSDVTYRGFYEASPFLKFAHFTANQAILEAIDGCDRVHVIDFGLDQGLQWPALIQALALRPCGPPCLRLTGIGPPSTDGRDYLREIGMKLADLARSVNVRFSFRGIAANRLDDVKVWMLHVADGEAIVINSVFNLHRSLQEPGSPGPIDSILGWIGRIRPKIVTVVEQEVDHNKPAFLDRFTEALFYYSAVFDSVEGGRARMEEAALAEVYLQREICNVVVCEGVERVERHEPLVKWRARMGLAGLSPVRLGSNAFRQASMLLALFSGEGFCVEEAEGSLMLGWHNRPLISASAWRGFQGGEVAVVGVAVENLVLNSSSNSKSNCSGISSSSSSNRR